LSPASREREKRRLGGGQHPETHPCSPQPCLPTPPVPAVPAHLARPGAAGSAWRALRGEAGRPNRVTAAPSPRPPARPQHRQHSQPPPPQPGSPVPAGTRTRLPAPRVPGQPVRQRLRAVPALEGLCGDRDTRECQRLRPGEGTAAGTAGTRGSHRIAGGPGVARRRRHRPGVGRTSSSSGARGCSGAGAGGLRAQRVTLGYREGDKGGDRSVVALTEQVHL